MAVAEGRRACRPSLTGKALSFSPVITRKDHTPFTIPQSYNASPELQRRVLLDMHSNSLPVCNLTTKAKSMESLAFEKNSPVIGNMTIKLWYSEEDEMLLVRLLHVDVLSVPSPSVIGSSWVCMPEVSISFASDKRKFWEAIGKNRWVVAPNSGVYIGVKKCSLFEKSLRLTCYDSRRRNDRIPIGHVFLPLRDLTLTSKSCVFNRTITVNSEPTGFSTGTIEVSLTWISSTHILELKIGKAKGLKSPRGILRRQFYAKVCVFVSGDEVKHWKTSANYADPNVDFDEGINLSLTANQLTESSILVYLFAKSIVKLSITSELIGTCIIGPYMCKDLRNLTQWERIIAKPFEEVTAEHKLYL